MSGNWLIRGGTVYDPLNGITGKVKDIYVKNGKIVNKIDEFDIKIFDATGMIVAPGNVEIHSHIAGPKLTAGRILRPEDHIKDPVKAKHSLRSGCGFSVPSTFITAYRYLSLGYTTLMEAAVPPLEARHALDELEDMPVVDKGMYILMGNNNIIFSLLRKKEYKKAKEFVGWLLNATGGYGIKIVNPGGTDSWKWGKIFNSLSDETDWNIKPIEIVKLLAESAEEFKLPHPIHFHTYNIGFPGNYKAALDTISKLKEYRAHLTHFQFYCYGGDSWNNFRSESVKVAEEIRKCPNITVDMGQVLFEDTTTMTADTPWQFNLHKISKNRWVSADVENETGSGIVPYTYKSTNPVNVIQWATGLELALLLDPWHIFLTTDSPNGGPFFLYPQVIEWLTSEDARKKIIDKLSPRIKKRMYLPNIHRELSLADIITMMSAGTAKALGLKNKGHLGIGADADIAVYKSKESISKTLSKVNFLLKGGKLVVKDGEIVDAVGNGKLLRVVTNVEDSSLEKYIKEYFDMYYSINFSNYKVEHNYFKNEEVVPCGGSI